MNINGDEGEDSGSEPGHAIQERGVGCFPVADLDADFDGQPTNGSEYLAMIQQVHKHVQYIVSILLIDGTDNDQERSGRSALHNQSRHTLCTCNGRR